nr:MAG TPA: hypothetical protein [Caudoviricetes sp.]
MPVFFLRRYEGECLEWETSGYITLISYLSGISLGN